MSLCLETQGCKKCIKFSITEPYQVQVLVLPHTHFVIAISSGFFTFPSERLCVSSEDRNYKTMAGERIGEFSFIRIMIPIQTCVPTFLFDIRIFIHVVNNCLCAILDSSPKVSSYLPTLGFIYVPPRVRGNILLCKFPCVALGNLCFTIICHFWRT